MISDIMVEALKYACTTPCIVEIYEDGIDEDGATNEDRKIETLCNFQSKYAWKNGDKSVNQSASCECIIIGDLDPTKPDIRGRVSVFGVVYEISNSEKARGLKGEIVFTRLLLK